eukprot:2278432-Pleurochrysis_carterae.AAC.1
MVIKRRERQKRELRWRDTCTKKSKGSAYTVLLAFLGPLFSPVREKFAVGLPEMQDGQDIGSKIAVATGKELA